MGRVTFVLLCLFVAFLPFEMMAYFGDIPSGGKQLGLLIVSMALVAFLFGQRVRLLSKPMVMRVVLCGYSVMSLVWSVAYGDTLHELTRILQLLVFVLLIWEFVDTNERQLWLLRSLAIGMFVPLLGAFSQYRSASQYEIEAGMRFGGGAQDLNYLGYMFSACVLALVYLATNPTRLDRFLRWVYWGSAVAFAVGAVLTGSRGGFICLLAAAFFSMIVGGLSRRRIFTIMQVMALAIVAYVLIRHVVPSVVLSRVTLSQDSGASIGDDPRIKIIRSGLEALSRYPLIGVGAGAFGHAIGDLSRASAHDTWLSVLVELGVVGLVLYVAFIVMLFRTAWRLPRREKLLYSGIMVIWLINSITCGSQHDKFSWFLHGMVMVQAAACAKLRPVRNSRALAQQAARSFRGNLPRFQKP